ncbi:hypothetical protein [Burkholderia glumae]|uniref:hypothetical protein n=3 Tax=Burkholderia glumae TaxID=337 RepID=UPI0013745B4F|nr:hypothetical protein [Burkholderia glumae]MCQ0036798.1 hypothetical protein [Burkholderia glumae]QHP94551.1 hypothetical protein EXE55_27755 [Burkholderia glumae]QJW82157.1 hypothetical protein GAS18_26830 [Burkholderia glumae]
MEFGNEMTEWFLVGRRLDCSIGERRGFHAAAAALAQSRPMLRLSISRGRRHRFPLDRAQRLPESMRLRPGDTAASRLPAPCLPVAAACQTDARVSTGGGSSIGAWPDAGSRSDLVRAVRGREIAHAEVAGGQRAACRGARAAGVPARAD